LTYNGTSASSTSTNTISNPSTSTSTNNNNNNNNVNGGKSWNILLDAFYRIFNVLVDNLSKREIILGDFNELLTKG
jgi:hypothetical protein